MQTTSQTWKDLYASGAARLEARAVIGGVTYTGVAPAITRALMQSGPEIGNAAAASCALTLRGVASSSVPRSAAVAVQMRLTDGTTSSEWLPAGTFYLSRRGWDPVAGALALECYDALLKADAAWEPSAGSWPRAMASVAAELATLLGLSLDARTVIPTGGVYYMDEPEAGATIRDALTQIAQLCGGNWIVTPANALRLVPFAPQSPDAVAVAAVLGGVDAGETVAVTGIRCPSEDATVLAGDDTGLVLDVSLAPVLAADLLERLEGAVYRPFTLSAAVCDPACELGDAVSYGSVTGILLAQAAALGPAFRCDLSAPFPAELADEYPYIGRSEKVLSLAKAYAREAVEALDDDLTQQEIFNRLTNNGAAQGMVLANGQLYVNASYINAGYLSAARIKGDTLTLGGSNNVNGTMQVLDANGDVAATLNNIGLKMTNGAVYTYSSDEKTRTLFSNGAIAIQTYSQYIQPIGWRDALTVNLDTDGAHVSSIYGGTLFIRGRGRLNLTNLDSGGALDTKYATVDMDDDTVSIQVKSGSGLINVADISLTKSNITFTLSDGGTSNVFELSKTASAHPLTVNNGGTGATDAAGARTNLGAVNKSGDTMTGNLGIKATWPGVSLYANGGTQETGALTSHRDNGRVYVTEHSTDGTKEEYYQLPIADGNGTYNILTTKIPVSSSQGGTGGPYFYTCSGKTSLVVTSSNGWGGFAVLSITASSAHLTAIGFSGSNAPNAVNIYGGDPGLNPQLSSSNTISCTLRSDRHYIIIGTDKVSSISAS